MGLVPDSEILRCKGPPVQNEEERKIMVEAVKWVGQVITGTAWQGANAHQPQFGMALVPVSLQIAALKSFWC